MPPQIHRHQTALYRRAVRLTEQGTLRTLDVRSWPSTIYESAEWTDGDLAANLREIRGFSEGPSVDGIAGFERQVRTSPAGDELVITRPPIACLAVRTSGELRYVAPARVRSRTVTVAEALDRLEATGEVTTPLSNSPAVG